MSQHEKRKLRAEKRAIKRMGNQRVRRQLRRALSENPEVETPIEPDYGRFRSSDLNGFDTDATRRRHQTPTRPDEDSPGVD